MKKKCQQLGSIDGTTVGGVLSAVSALISSTVDAQCCIVFFAEKDLRSARKQV